MPRYRIRFTSALDDFKISHEEFFEFSDSDIEALQRFCTDVRRLEQFRLFGELAPTTLSFSYKQDEGMKCMAPAIDDEAWSAVMLVLRPLTLDSAKSKHDFYKIRNLLARQATTAECKAHLNTIKDGFQGKHLPMQFSMGRREPGQELEFDKSGRIKGTDTMEKIYEKWVYAFEHHDDKDKQAYFDAMFRMTPREAVKALIFQYLVEKLRAMSHLATFIEGILNIEPESTDSEHPDGCP